MFETMLAHKQRRIGLALLLLILGSSAANAQSALLRPFDGASIGIGLNVYHGDLDGNPDSEFVKYVGAANLHLLAGVDRRFGALGVGLDFNYQRLTARSGRVDMANNIASLDFVVSMGVGGANQSLLRLYAGIAPTLLIPRYYRFPSDREGYDDLGTRFVTSFPVGIILQDRIRLGIRVTTSDLLEGYRGTGGDRDYLTFINLGYRFDLGNR